MIAMLIVWLTVIRLATSMTSVLEHLPGLDDGLLASPYPRAVVETLGRA
jgi:hypothetical protein